MSVYHGKSAKLYAWDGNNDTHTSEACTEDGATAQITDSTKRILDPNETQIFTDTGGKNVTEIDYTIGKAYFDGNVTVVTATGKHVVVANLDQMGNMFSWSIEATMDVIESSVFGDSAKTFEAGIMSWAGSAEGYFLNSTWKDSFDTLKMWFVRFYIDASHYFQGWCHINGITQNAAVDALIKEPLTFNGYGFLSYA